MLFARCRNPRAKPWGPHLPLPPTGNYPVYDKFRRLIFTGYPAVMGYVGCCELDIWLGSVVICNLAIRIAPNFSVAYRRILRQKSKSADTESDFPRYRKLRRVRFSRKLNWLGGAIFPAIVAQSIRDVWLCRRKCRCA